MSNKHKAHPTMKEDKDFLAWLCGEKVEFPYFKYNYIVKEKVL